MKGLPKCAVSCLIQAIPSSICSLTDIACICTNQQLNAQVQACGLQSCSIKENLSSQKALYEICDYPVTVDNKVFPIIMVVGMIVSAITCILRIVGRVMASGFGWDDGVALLSMGTVIAVTVVGFLNAHFGLGKDLWFIPFNDITTILHLYYTIEALYVASIALSKISMLLLYLRLFPTHKLRLVIKIILGFTILWGIVILLVNVFACQPISYFWNMWDGEHKGKCLDAAQLLWAHAIINIVLDAVIIVLPQPALFNLQTSMKRKLWLAFMFSAGIVVTVISILRFYYSLNFDMLNNFTKTVVPVSIYSLLEVYLSIIVASLPGVRAFCAIIHSRIHGPTETYKYDSNYTGPSSGPSGRGSAPPPSTLRSGTFDFEIVEPGKRGEFIALQETRSDSRVDGESRSRSRSQSRSASRALSRALSRSGAQTRSTSRGRSEVEGEAVGVTPLHNRSSRAWFDDV
ncbi:CFEM domain-containing protein [Aspergillus stella-maris]|uniref:CFEM domain-containing protein n=1 Tax=Aspergillus stella-maris TaxID=1810926 RepID=UPI003CCD0A45